ncbi:MAG: formate dehydrogenase accessory sulfurtransferase FdhD [bacterium]
MIDPGVRRIALADGEDDLVVEEPLEIRVDGRPLAVLMRTPGEDLDLAAGFLATEGVVEDPRDLAGLSHCLDPSIPDRHNVVLAALAAGVEAGAERFERAQRALHALSGCGLCGKASIERVFQHAPPLPARRALAPGQIATLAEALRAAQPRFARTGGLHGAALFSADGAVLVAREDVGRHNAVDKVIGARLRADHWPLEGTALVVSSRAGFEIVQKALVARIGAVIAVGAASTLAHDLAVEGRLALYSFARGGRYRTHA